MKEEEEKQITEKIKKSQHKERELEQPNRKGRKKLLWKEIKEKKEKIRMSVKERAIVLAMHPSAQ